MTTLRNNAEGGTAGAAALPAATGGASGDAFTSRAAGAGATAVFDATHHYGTMAYLFTSNGIDEYELSWDVASSTVGYGETYIWVASTPSDSIWFARCRLNGVRTFSISVTPDRKIELHNSDNTRAALSSGTIAFGQFVRIEWFVRTTTVGKRLEVRWYNNPNSTTMSGSVFSTTISMTSSFNQVQYGIGSNVAASIWHDQLGYSTTDWMGPARVVVPVGQAVETDIANQVAMPFVWANQATETDTAFEVRPGRLFPVGQATETDTANAVTPGKIAHVGQAVEQDVAQQITPFLYGPGWNPKVIEIRLFDDAGTQTKFTPDWVKIDFTSIFSAEGVVTIEYPPEGLNYTDLTTPDTEGALFLNNVEVDGSRFVISEKSGDVIKPDATAQIQGKTWVTRLDEILVYPPNWPDTSTKDHTFTNATVGVIMSTLLQEGQDRSVDAANKTTWSFTNGADSNGDAWAKQATITFKAGTNLLDVLKNLTKLGMCDFTTKGRELWITNQGALGTDRTGGANPVVLFKGRDFSDAPVNWSTKDLISTCLVEGDDGLLIEVVDSSAVTEWARREGYASQSGVSDSITLEIIGQSTIDINDHKREERSHELTFDTSGFLALYDYFVGDMVAVDTEGTQGFYRVMQIRITWSDKGDQTGGVTLNDRFEDLAVKLQQQIDNFSGVVVSSAPGPGPDPDTTIPKAPTGLGAGSTVYQGAGGFPIVQFVVSWTAVTQNTDNSAITDLDHYEVQTKPTAQTSWGPSNMSDDASMYLYGFTSGVSYDFRVRAVDRNDNKSAWSSTYTATAVYDTTPPTAPSTPVLQVYLGTIKVIWDGKNNVGAAMPGDFRYTAVHVSTVNNFTPDATTVVDYLDGAGTSVISGLTYGTPYYVKLVAIDTSGNQSTPSTQATATPTQVVQTDLGGNVVGLDNIQFKDTTNHVPDGSFETSERRTAVLAGQNTSIWSFVNSGAGHGTWALRGAASVSPSTTRLIPLTPNGSIGVELPIPPSTNLYCRMMYKGDTSPTGGVGLRIVWRNAAGTTTNTDVLTGSVGTGTWTTIDAQTTSPSDAVSYSVWLFINSTATTGFWYFDRVEVRDVIDSIIVKDAAITTAKIANLAINDAKIGSVSAGKITAGTLSADVVVGSRIKTADTGARVELNSTGLKAYDSSGTNTVNISNTGSATFIGTFTTGVVGGGTAAVQIVTVTGTGTSQLTFYDGSGTQISTITAKDTTNGLQLQTIDASVSPVGSCYVKLMKSTLQIACNGGGATFSGHTSQITFYNTSELDITSQTSTNLSELYMEGDDYMFMQGRFNFMMNDPAVIMGQTELSSSGSGFTQAFVTTMKSEAYMVATLEDSPALWCGLTGITGSNFSVSFSGNTVGFSQTFWNGFRGAG